MVKNHDAFSVWMSVIAVLMHYTHIFSRLSQLKWIQCFRVRVDCIDGAPDERVKKEIFPAKLNSGSVR